MGIIRRRAWLFGGLFLFRAAITQRNLNIGYGILDQCNNTIYGNYSYSELEESPSPFHKNSSFSEDSAINKLIHTGQFGLGHRLTKISSAWHLTKALNLTRMELKWNDCSGMGNIFPRLFGDATVDDPGSMERAAMENNGTRNNVGKIKYVTVTNDVSGYYGAQNYKAWRVELPSERYMGEHSPFLKKLESDAQLFRILRQRFIGKEDVIRFMDEHKFREHFVVGLHLRLGNGEQVHFKHAGRGVKNELEFVYNLLDLIRSFLEKVELSHPERFILGNERGIDCASAGRKKRPILFLATDTPKYIPIIANDTALFGWKTVVVPQTRVESGVSFHELKEGEKCVQGWKDMLLDSMVLSFSDVLIAPLYSSFTQTLPMSLVFDGQRNTKGPVFCEGSHTGKSMTCLEDIRTWLFRDDSQKLFNYNTMSQHEEGNNTIVHHIEVHLPDVVESEEYKKAVKFLDLANHVSGSVGFGPPFNPKYRGKECRQCTDFLITKP